MAKGFVYLAVVLDLGSTYRSGKPVRTTGTTSM
jgi:hypothetical protein